MTNCNISYYDLHDGKILYLLTTIIQALDGSIQSLATKLILPKTKEHQLHII